MFRELFYMYVCDREYICVPHVCRYLQRPEEGSWKRVVSHLTRMLGSKPGSSARSTTAFNCWAISSVPIIFNVCILMHIFNKHTRHFSLKNLSEIVSHCVAYVGLEFFWVAGTTVQNATPAFNGNIKTGFYLFLVALGIQCLWGRWAGTFLLSLE